MEIRAPSRVLAWSSELFVLPLLGTGPSRHTQKRFLSTPVRSFDVRGAWAGLSAGQLPPATKHLSHFFPQRCSLHPWPPKLVCPDKKFCSACLPNFQTWTLAAWLWPGPESQLSKFLAKPQSWGAAPRFAVFPKKFTPGHAGPPSAPPAPKTCTVTQTYKSGSPAGSGGGEGQGVVLLGVPRNENLES